MRIQIWVLVSMMGFMPGKGEHEICFFLHAILIWVQTVCIGYQQRTKVAANTYMQTVCKDYQHKLLLRKQSDLGPRCLSMRMREATVCTQARVLNVSSVPLIIPSSICHAGSKRNNCMYACKIFECELCPFD